MLWVIWIEPVIIRYKLVVRLLLFLWALPLPGACKDFISWHEYSHPCEKPCSVRLFLLAVSDRSFISIKFFLTRHGLIARNCFHEELLQLLQQELLVWPWKAFGNICRVRLLGTEEVSLLDFHHELERASSRAKSWHDVAVPTTDHVEILGWTENFRELCSANLVALVGVTFDHFNLSLNYNY